MVNAILMNWKEGWKKNLLVLIPGEGVVFVAGSHNRSKIVAAIRDSNEIKFKRFD